MERSPSTLSRELRRNATPSYKVYLSHRAHERAVTEKEGGRCSAWRLKDERIVSYVWTRLAEGWSPELIAGRISQEMRGVVISYEAVYQYIYGSRPSG